MAEDILPNSSSFRNSIQLADRVPVDRLSLFLERIIIKLAKEEKPFNEAELSKLQQVLGLTSEQLEDLIDACTFTFEQAAIHSVSATNLVNSLKLSGLSSSLAAFQDLWTRSGHILLTAFKEKSFGAPGYSQLVDVQWRVHVQVASSNERRQREPMGILQMNLSTPAKGYKTTVEKSLMLGFSHTELFDFYEKLEQIQEQLDSLS